MGRLDSIPCASVGGKVFRTLVAGQRLGEFHDRIEQLTVALRAKKLLRISAVRDRFFRVVRRDGAAALAGGDEEAMARLAARGAAAVGLEVYGGAVVREANGALQLIDLNDWPSYGPCRSEAADAIRSSIVAQLSSRTS